MRTYRGKRVCANPMQVQVKCTSCSWTYVITKDSELKTRRRICPKCNKPTELILE